MLPHYLVKFECSTVELYDNIITFKAQNRFYSNYLDHMSMQINLYYIVL